MADSAKTILTANDFAESPISNAEGPGHTCGSHEAGRPENVFISRAKRTDEAMNGIPHGGSEDGGR
jgi:hypothetical protein